MSSINHIHSQIINNYDYQELLWYCSVRIKSNALKMRWKYSDLFSIKSEVESLYIYRALFAECGNSKPSTLNLQLSANGFEVLLDYIYSGSLAITSENSDQVLHAANCLQVRMNYILVLADRARLNKVGRLS